MDELVDALKEGRMDGWIHGWDCGWNDRRMDIRLKNGRINVCVELWILYR
jgi:hypothetical protein